jgi:hypothetical protein
MEGSNMADYRIFALLKATPDLRAIYPDLSQLTAYSYSLFNKAPYNQFATVNLSGSFEAVGAPSLEWTHAPAGAGGTSTVYTGGRDLTELVVSYRFTDPVRVKEFIGLVGNALAADPTADIRNVGADVGVGGSDHWCPGVARAALFRDRAAARRTINAAALGPNFSGQRVNVVIIDEGLNQAALGANWGDGLDWVQSNGPLVLRGTAQRTSHGMMIARSILDLAPNAKLFDLPLLPERIAKVDPYIGTSANTSSAFSAYAALFACIAGWHTHGFPGPWVLVNAWAIYDRSSEAAAGNYTENNALTSTTLDHPFIQQVKAAANGHNFDVIFAAGNCGVFCPRIRCGGRDRGNHNSIWGANALREVITAGAVRTDEKWIGYSSQGPGPSVNGLEHDKPDLCAPSNFHETDDAHVVNSGTSASCAMTAGVVAALRSNPQWNQTLVPPSAMRTALINGARKTQGPAWNERLGYGILDVAGTISLLP